MYWIRTFGFFFSPKYATRGETTYSTLIRTDFLFDYSNFKDYRPRKKTGNGNLKFLHVDESNVRTLRVCLYHKSRDTTRETWRSKGELKLTPYEQLAEEESLVTWIMVTTPIKFTRFWVTGTDIRRIFTLMGSGGEELLKEDLREWWNKSLRSRNLMVKKIAHKNSSYCSWACG